MEHIYITLLQVVLLFSLGLAYYIWQVRLPGTRAFGAAMVAVVFWSLSGTLQLISPSQHQAEYWVTFRFASLMLMPAAWFVFIMQFNDVVKRVSLWHIGAVFAVPLASIVLVLTNASHHLFFDDFVFLRTGNLLLLQGWQPGAWFYGIMVYSYLLALAGALVLFYFIVRSRGYQRRNNVILLLGYSSFNLSHLLYLLGLPPGIWYDLVPVCYIFSCSLYTWAIFRFQMFGLLPTIRNSLIPWMNDGLMVLDENRHMLYMNPVIENSLGLICADSLGCDALSLLPQLSGLFAGDPAGAERRTEINLQIRDRHFFFDVRTVMMDRVNFGRQGWLLIFHDITQRNRNREMIINAKKEWELTFDAVSSMIILADRAGYIFRCNRITCDMFNDTYTHILGQHISRIFFGDDHPAAQQPFPRSGEVYFPRLGGWFELSAYSLDHAGEDDSATVYIVQDITSRKKTEQERNLYARRLESIHKIDHAILSYHTTVDIAQAGLNQVNELSLGEYCAVWLIDQETLQVKTLSFLQSESSSLSQPAGLYSKQLPPVVLGGGQRFIDDIQRQSPLTEIDRITMEHGWVSYAMVALAANRELLGVLCLASSRPVKYDSSQRDMLREMGMSMAVGLQNAVLFEKIRHLAITDPLTGLYNRRHFFAMAENELQRARRFAFDISLVMLDIDFFKNINDEFGHLVGDQVLQQMATAIHLNMRRYDVLARFGGEEFIILLPRTDIQQAKEFSERLLAVIRQLDFTVDDTVIRVTASVGIASMSGRKIESIEPLIEYADRAMYTAKSTGRDRMVALELD